MPDLSFLNRQNDILHNISNSVLCTFFSKKENNLFFYYSIQTIVAKSTKRLLFPGSITKTQTFTRLLVGSSKKLSEINIKAL